MAKTWYPVIDYSACAECGACIARCSHGVYDPAKVPSPVVKAPESCVDHCHSCGNDCPVGAITYVGDDTGWAPPKGEPAAEGPCCCGRIEAAADKKAVVEYLYLDLSTCERCQGTDAILDEVMLVLAPALQLAGYAVEYRKVEMGSAELAEQYRFLSSPTIRINGQDICQTVAENSCDCCSEISGTPVDCRVFTSGDETYEIPPKEMLAESILRAIFEPSEPGDCDCKYELPENLQRFYAGKKSKSGCSCGDKCC